MSELPRGTVTFLFTDIEGSTQLARGLGGRWPEVLAEHQHLLRDAFAAHDGHEVDTQGDSFFVAFPSAHAAVQAAIEGQRALAAHPWPDGAEVKVRMGLHTGPAKPTGGRYTGLAVHRASRISAAGHGGQILLSQTTHDLIEDEEEQIPGCKLRELGQHQLRDFERPVRLYQVEAKGLKSEFPPLRTEAPPPAAEPSRYPRRSVLVGALAGVIAAAVAIPIFAFGGRGSSAGLADLGGSALGVVSGDGDVQGAIKLQGSPSSVAAGGGSIWVASADANAVYAIDASTNTVRDVIQVENAPGGVAVGAGSVWVTNSLGASVLRLDPKTGTDLGTIPVGSGPTALTVAGATSGSRTRVTRQSRRFAPTPAGSRRRSRRAPTPVGSRWGRVPFG